MPVPTCKRSNQGFKGNAIRELFSVEKLQTSGDFSVFVGLFLAETFQKLSLPGKKWLNKLMKHSVKSLPEIACVFSEFTAGGPKSSELYFFLRPIARTEAPVKVVMRMSAGLGRMSCRHPNREHPRLQLSHLPKAQRKHHVWPESVVHSSSVLELLSCHHHQMEGPK